MIKIFENFNEPEVKIYYWDNGQKKSENWVLNDKSHREDGPAVQEWYDNGQKMIESWYLNNKRHREDGPDYQQWYENGQKWSEQWSLNGKYHREDGPANQWLFPNGQKSSEFWLLNDIRYSREEWVEELKKIGSPHYEKQQMLYNMEKYNL